MTEKTKKKLNRKMICIICGMLAVMVVLTSFIFAFSKKENSEVLQATKSTANALNLANNEYMHVEEDASKDKVAVPNGYVGSSVAGENEIDTGYVIYEGEEAVTENNVANAQKNRNQYVWVPVPDVSKFYGTDANGKKWGKQYNFITGTNSSELFDEVTGTYPYDWSENNGVITYKTRNREPEVIWKYNTDKGYDMDSYLKKQSIEVSTTHEFLIQLEKEFNRMIASVEKYGGFYIGRYETGNVYDTIPVVKKGDNVISGGVSWYALYKKCKNLKGENTNVVTGMIWGNQWDRTLMWLIETGNKTKEQISDDSTSWGNYKKSEFEYEDSNGNTTTKNEGSGTTIPTGSSEYTKANNIYDLAGNVDEWTMQTSDIYTRVFRGGSYSDEYSVDSRVTADTLALALGGCRAMLYIK